MSEPAQYPPQPYTENTPAMNTDKTVTQQPQTMPNMNAGGNRNVKNIAVTGEGRDWSHGFFDCLSEPGLCIFSCCCPSMQYQKNANRIEHLNSKNTPDPERGGLGIGGPCAIHCCLTLAFGFGWVLEVGNRSSIRGRYGIIGDAFSDCFAAFCCHSCELTQASRELELEENSYGRA